MDPIKVDFQKKGTGKKDIVIPPEKAGLKTVICILGTLVAAAIAYYIMLPPLNLKATEFYMYLGIVFGAFIALTALTSGLMSKPEYGPYVRKQSVIPGILIGVLVLVVAVGFAVSSVVFRAKAYSKIMPVNEKTKFSEDVDALSADNFKHVPRLDQDAANVLAQKALSGLADENLISQYIVSPTSTQFNYNGRPVRAMSLQYANLIKWFTNRKNGLPGFVLVDMAEPDDPSKPSYNYMQAPQGGIKYSPYEHFGRLLKRHLRFEYPTLMFAETTFEVDDQGNPYWVCPFVDKTIGLFGGVDVKGIVLVDADSPDGACKEYSIEAIKTNPEFQWLDRIYSSELLIQQYDYYGKYEGGFWNSVLGQKNVKVSTAGHNYLALNDDVYLYTGVTSVTSDEAIIGFVLVNQRTKEANFYRVDGTKEANAQNVATGMVNDLKYSAAFPLLINVGGEPTYFMGLKDDSNNVQQYALINVRQFNSIKVNAKSVADCVNAYTESMRANGIKVNDIDVEKDPVKPTPNEQNKTAEGLLVDIRSAVIGGNTHFYFKLDSAETYFSITAQAAESAILAKLNDKVKFTYQGEAKNNIITIQKLEFLPANTEGDPAA